MFGILILYHVLRTRLSWWLHTVRLGICPSVGRTRTGADIMSIDIMAYPPDMPLPEVAHGSLRNLPSRWSDANRRRYNVYRHYIIKGEKLI